MASAAETNSRPMVAAVLSRTLATVGCSSFGFAACAAAATVNSSKQHTPALSSCFIDSSNYFAGLDLPRKKPDHTPRAIRSIGAPILAHPNVEVTNGAGSRAQVRISGHRKTSRLAPSPRSKKVHLGCRFFCARRLRLKLESVWGVPPSSFFSDQSPQNLDGVRVAGT